MYEGTVKSTATPYLNVRNSPNGTKVGELKPDTVVVVEYIQNGWAKVISPAVSNRQDRQWCDVQYLDLAEQPADSDPDNDPKPEPESGPVLTTNLHLSFDYDENDALTKVHILEQYSDGTDLSREWYPAA